MDEIFQEFKHESLELVETMMEILEEAEENPRLRSNLDRFGQIVDRIMGGAKSLLVMNPQASELQTIADYAEICKIVGYRGSQIEGHDDFFALVVAFLLDASEFMQESIQSLGTEQGVNLKSALSETFLDRLKWINNHFSENVRSSLALEKEEVQTDPAPTNEKQDQQRIDELLRQLGLE